MSQIRQTEDKFFLKIPFYVSKTTGISETFRKRVAVNFQLCNL